MNPIWLQRLRRGAAAVWSFTRPLLNATLLLAVIAAIAGLVLMNSTRSLVDDTMAQVKSGVLHEIDEDAKRLFSEIDNAYAEFERLEEQVAGILDDPQSLLDKQTKEDIKSVRDDLARIAGDLDRISTGQLDISQKTLEKLAVSLVRAYGELRGCKTGADERRDADHRHGKDSGLAAPRDIAGKAARPTPSRNSERSFCRSTPPRPRKLPQSRYNAASKASEPIW